MGVRSRFLPPKWLNIIGNSCVFLHNSHNMEAGILFYNPYKCVTGPVSLDFLHLVTETQRREVTFSSHTFHTGESAAWVSIFWFSGTCCFFVFFFRLQVLKNWDSLFGSNKGFQKTALVVLNKLERPEELRPKEIETDQLFPCITFH